MIHSLWSGLKARMILTYLVIFLVSAAIMAGRAGSLFAQTTLNSARRDLEVQSFLIALALADPWAGYGGGGQADITAAQLQRLAGSFARGAGSQLTILDNSGHPLATSLNVVPSNQRDRAEVAAALSGDIDNDIRFDPVTRQRMIFAAAPVQRDGRVVGVVQLAVPYSVVLGESKAFWLSLGLTALLAALAAALAGWWLASQLVKPVGRLRDAATRLAAGDLDERVPAEGVAEIVHLAEAFNHMAEQVQETINRQRNFVASASHELRTPLTNIKLRAEALGNGALEDPAVAGRFVGEIESEANRLGRMAMDLLALSRQDASPAIFREPVDLGVIVTDTLREMRLRADKGSVSLIADIPAGIPPVPADAVGIHTVLMNLLDNALQYTPAGGTVTVAVNPAILSQEPAVALVVGDTGEGIPSEDLPHIFERFYRADKARSRRRAQRDGAIAGSGAGLGLAIVQGVVNEHGGTVSVESVLGQGTTITVVLPLGPMQEPAVPALA